MTWLDILFSGVQLYFIDGNKKMPLMKSFREEELVSSNFEVLSHKLPIQQFLGDAVVNVMKIELSIPPTLTPLYSTVYLNLISKHPNCISHISLQVPCLTLNNYLHKPGNS